MIKLTKQHKNYRITPKIKLRFRIMYKTSAAITKFKDIWIKKINMIDLNRIR